MFYVLYFQFNGTLETLKKQLNDLLSSGTEVRLTDHEILAISEWATLRFSDRGEKIEFASEDYGLVFNICAWIDITNSYAAWSSKILELVNGILNLSSGPCVLEANGEKPILLRNQDGLFVDCDLGGSEPMPFEILRTSWTEATLKRPDNS
jgi:hypothetical protein